MLQKLIEPRAKRPSTVPLAHSKAAPSASNPTSTRPCCSAETGAVGSWANTTRYTPTMATTTAGQNHGRLRSPRTIQASTIAISGWVCWSTNVSAKTLYVAAC